MGDVRRGPVSGAEVCRHRARRSSGSTPNANPRRLKCEEAGPRPPRARGPFTLNAPHRADICVYLI
jgi:hypothetical protein